jgi:hypothetical protein
MLQSGKAMFVWQFGEVEVLGRRVRLSDCLVYEKSCKLHGVIAPFLQPAIQRRWAVSQAADYKGPTLICTVA